MTSSIQFLIVSILLWLIIFAMGLIRITDPISVLTRQIVSPLLQTVNRIKIQTQNEFAILLEAKTLSNKYKASNEQNLQLRSEVAQLAIIQEENSRLREQLGAPVLDKFKLVPAKVISRENGLTVVYDKTDTVAKGSIVVYKNNFVGRVNTATQRSATIHLVTDPSIQMPVSIINNKKKIIKGISLGQFGTGITVERIEQNEEIEKGNSVILDKAPGTPEGIVLGEISDIQKIESELFQRALVRSFLSFDLFDTVFIIQ